MSEGLFSPLFGTSCIGVATVGDGALVDDVGVDVDDPRDFDMDSLPLISAFLFNGLDDDCGAVDAGTGAAAVFGVVAVFEIGGVLVLDEDEMASCFV